MNFKNLLFIIILLCVSCGKKDTLKTNVDSSIHLYPIKETKTVDDIENYIDSIFLFQIEMNDNALFSNVKKTIIGKSGEFYLLDIDNNLITFDCDGKHCRRFAKRGGANNEYIYLEDIALSVDYEHLLMLESSSNVIKYPVANTGSAIERTALDVIYPIDAIAPNSDNSIYCFASYPSVADEYKESYYQLYNVDKAGKIVNRYLPCNDFTTTIMNITQSKNNTYLLRPQNSEHIVYRLSQDSLEVAYKIDFEDENIPFGYYYDVANMDILKYIKSPYFKVPLHLYETDDVLYFSANGRNRQYSYIYSLNKKEGINWIENDTDIESLQIIASDNTFIYAIVYPTIIEDYNSDKHGILYNYIREYIKDGNFITTSNDNPLIAKIKFKI